MENELLDRLQAVDPAILTDVVRQDQNDPSFEITQWSVRRLSDKGVINSDGLWLFSGQGQDQAGVRSWSIVLKILKRPEKKMPVNDLNYWERELLVAQSGLTQNMPGPVRAPRFYRVDPTEEGGWLWMELVPGITAGPWTTEQYAFAAQAIGEWNGRYALGEPIQEFPWLAERHHRSWLSWIDLDQAWEFPLNQKYLTDAQRRRCAQLWEEREQFFQAWESLPAVFSHFDSQMRNIAVRPGPHGADELVLIDWANCGRGPLGSELCFLLGMSNLLCAGELAPIKPLAEVVFESYMCGLSKAGWQGSPDQVRFVMTAWLGLYLGCIYPGAMSVWCSDDMKDFALQQFGISGEALYLKWLPIFDFFLDCGDEARLLLNKPGLM
jgi:hypothetical protein